MSKPSTIPYSAAVVGDILCSDRTIVSKVNYQSSGKVGIGVVFRRTSNAVYALSLVVSSPYSYWDEWSQAGDLEELANYPDYSSAITDLDGYTSTYAIFWSGIGIYTASANFSTNGTSSNEWYTPAMGELYIMSQNRATLDASLSLLNGNLLSSYGSWSITEVNASTAWYLDINEGVGYQVNKQLAYPVRRAIKLTY